MWSCVKFHTSVSLTCACLLMILPLTKTQNNTRFYHMLSNKEVYNGSLKIWHHYIRAFFHRKVYLCEIHSTFNMKDLLQKAWTVGGIFTKYSKQKLNTTLRQTNVKRASGQIFLEAIPGKLSKALLQCNTSMCIYIWQFNLNFKFSLVLKFQQLQFSSSALDCYNGNISISGINYSKQSTYENKKLFYFCGSYSSFTIYPKSINALFLNLFAGVEVKFHLNGFFEIIDSRFIVSHQLNGTNFLQMSLLKVREKYNLYHFYIQIENNLCIQVKTENKFPFYCI